MEDQGKDARTMGDAAFLSQIMLSQGHEKFITFLKIRMQETKGNLHSGVAGNSI